MQPPVLTWPDPGLPERLWCDALFMMLAFLGSRAAGYRDGRRDALR
ncbi:hypothetical protein [Streptomyces sp. NPDC010273]